MPITKVTESPPRLTSVVDPPPGEQCRYGVAFPFQVAPRLAALLCCLRNEGYPAGDFENGSDVFLFDSLDNIDPAKAIPIVRNTHYVNARGERRIVIEYPVTGAFVPLGALDADGRPHPHAGTGFGVGESWEFPLLGKGHYNKAHKRNKMIMRLTVYQLSYDTNFFLIPDTDVYCSERPLRAAEAGSEWIIMWPGLKQGIPDGNDLLIPVGATRGDARLRFPGPSQPSDPRAAGIARWRCHDGKWSPVSFVPVVISDKGGEWIESSIVRDLDGSLLFSARGCGERVNHLIRVWRSEDNGVTWRLAIEVPDARGQAPVTLNAAADGTPYLICSRYGHERDWLIIYPLNEKRDGLEQAIDVRNALEEFGPPPKGPVWFMDHSQGETLQLGDGQWHHILSYRNMDRGEHAAGAPTPWTGQYLEEVFSDGPARPVWRFE